MSKQDDAAGEMLIREVEEDLRRDYYARLWSRYGNWVIATAILVVAVVAGYEGWQAWKARKSAEDAARFAAVDTLLQDNKTDAALEALGKIAAESTTGYATLSALEQAALLLREGKGAEAIAVYEKIVANTGTPAVYRDVARLLLALQYLDTADVGKVEEMLRPLTAPTSAWRSTALEITAAALTRKGEKDRAIDLYKQISSDPQFSREARMRASGMLAAAGVSPVPEKQEN